MGGDPGLLPGTVSAVLEERLADVVTVALAVFDRMGRAHTLALGIDQKPAEQARRVGLVTVGSRDAVGVQSGLRGLEQSAVNDRTVRAGMSAAFVHGLADVDAVGEQSIERATRERLAAEGLACGA